MALDRSMDQEPPKDLATRAFQKRVLDEFAAVRREQSQMRNDIADIRNDVNEIRAQQTAMASHVTAIDQRLTILEERVDSRLKETRPIWEAVQAQLQRLDEKFDIVLHDLYEVRGEMRIHGRRIGDLERRVLP